MFFADTVDEAGEVEEAGGAEEVEVPGLGNRSRRIRESDPAAGRC
ncbi:hypothetical protein [Streptomyces sp. NPDC048623]